MTYAKMIDDEKLLDIGERAMGGSECYLFKKIKWVNKEKIGWKLIIEIEKIL